MNTNQEMKDKITLSVHVANIPCQEEFYMGVNASYDAYEIHIPTKYIPKELLEIINKKDRFKSVTGIAILRE